MRALSLKRFEGKLADKLEDEALFNEFTAQAEQIAAYYESREYNKAIREIMALTDKPINILMKKRLG